jgi:hypothetical protein
LSMAVRDVILVGVLLFALGSAFFITHYVGTTIVTSLSTNSAYNQSHAAVQALQGVTNTINRLDYLILLIFIGLNLGLMITAYQIPGNPIFAFIYFIVLIIGVALSTAWSNFWETFTASGIFGLTINSFPITNHLLSKLPFYMAAMGFLGLIIMFAKPHIQAGEYQ